MTNCNVAMGDLALLSSQRAGADAPRYIESTEIGAAPGTVPPRPARAAANGVGVRGSRAGGAKAGTLGLFAAAAERSAVLRAAFEELVDLWQLDADAKGELQEGVRRCEYQPGDVVVEQVRARRADA